MKVKVALLTATPDGNDVDKDILPKMCIKLQNSDVLSNLAKKLSHLPRVEQEQITSLIKGYSHLFSDSPNRASMISHTVIVGDSAFSFFRPSGVRIM